MPATDLRSELLSNGPCERAAAPFRLLRVTGPDAGEFLHRLCTQDVLGLPDGGLRPAAFLDAKGKLLVTCLIGRLASSYWLEVDAEQFDRLAALLDRYHFTEKLERAAFVSCCDERIALAPGVAAPGVAATGGAIVGSAGVVELHCERRGVTFHRRHQLDQDAGHDVASPLAECLRLCAGFVRVGRDTEPSTLALEADLDDHCSTTKGCYTGQEIVARIHTYGHVNRKLCLLRLPPGQAIEVPEKLHDDEQTPVGRVMRAVVAPGAGSRLGTGYLPADFQSLGTKVFLADGTAVEVVGYPPLPARPDLPA